tara:strand:- start:456 stop:1652 length:1197 start_codon:yes stop_codon:yes gene_type:complete
MVIKEEIERIGHQRKKYEEIYFCSGHPFTHRDVISQLVYRFNSAGKISKLIDVSQLSEEWREYNKHWDDLVEEQWLLKIKNFNDLKSTLQNIESKSVLVIFLFTPIGSKAVIWKIFRKAGFDRGFLSPGGLPIFKDSESTKGLLKLKEHLLHLARIIKCKVKERLDLCIISGDAFLKDNPYLFSNSGSVRVIHSHSFDYEKYRYPEELSSESRQTEESGVLFLDQAFTTHPDRLIRPHGTITDEGTYYPICQSLTILEKIFNERISIASHPKGSSLITERLFSKFRVITGDTISAINKSRLIISNSSTAIQWAVLLNKPLLLITTPELKRTSLYTATKGLADLLNLQVIDSTEIINKKLIPEWPSPVKSAYDKYIYNYVRSKMGEEIPIFEQLYKELC